MSTATKGKVVPFKRQPKTNYSSQVPDGFLDILRDEAEKRGWTLAMTHTYLICRGSNTDPAKFGIPVETGEPSNQA